MARRLAAQEAQAEVLAEKTCKQIKRSYEVKSFRQSSLWLRPGVCLHSNRKAVLESRMQGWPC